MKEVKKILTSVNNLVAQVNREVKTRIGEVNVDFKEGKLVKEYRLKVAKKLREIAGVLEKKEP